ncbi:MAG TPA: fibrinogen-like YCDxxxxGGGW domain-containing protein [Nannocystis sp.]
MAVYTRPVGAIAGLAVALALPGCLDENPKFQEPTTTSGASAGATTTTGGPGPTTGAPTTGPGTTGTTGAAMSSSGEATTTGSTTQTTTGTSTASTGVEGVCGDGVVDVGEECDDGPANAPDAACTPECTIAACGDGYVYPEDEDCEDGNGDIHDGCVECIIPYTCEEIRFLVPMAMSGPYKIDVDGPGPGQPIPAFCDMVTLGGGWTVIERSPRDQPIGHALFIDAPVGAPEDPQFRFDRATMELLAGNSEDVYIGCGADYLLTSVDFLFAGEDLGQSCSNFGPVEYKEAVVKGHKLQGVWLCTGFTGDADNECAPGAWHIDESEQFLCDASNFPWNDMMPISSESADLFAVDADTLDGMPPIHECHKPGAVRHVMMR